MNEIFSKQIQLFRSFFKGREDVFAIRWEKGTKSGYLPAYHFDPNRFRAHKMIGGTFQNYNDKTYLKLTDVEIAKHLKGEQLIGLYPLLSDNTSWFIVTEFDEKSWMDESRTFITACNEIGIPAYLERSPSGKGGHVWIFFEQPYPAIKTRKIFFSLLEQSGAYPVAGESSGFDRFFPNQDFHSGKGLGNLIALPLFRKTPEQGNSCFIDTNTLRPVKDQFEFLSNIKRISLTVLDKLYQSISIFPVSTLPGLGNGKLAISLSNNIRISREGMTTPLINFLEEELNFANTEFIVKRKIGKNTFNTKCNSRFVEETENEVIIPGGFIGKLIRFCRENRIDHDFIDKRKKGKQITFLFNAQLRDHQQSVIEAISKNDLGVIVVPPSSGKTIIGLKIIAEKNQNALIIVHREQLVEQWADRIETFLHIPKNEIGKIGQGKINVGNKITIATIQNLTRELNKVEQGTLATEFGTIIVDECRHIPAETFRNTIGKLQSAYLYGLTATPFKMYNDGKLIFIYLGEIIAEIKSSEISASRHAKIIIRNTHLDVPFNSRTDKFEILSKILVHDSTRNKLILEDVKAELNEMKKVVLITEREEHIDSLYQYLKQTFETITLRGEDSESNRNSKLKILKEENYQVLITTGQFFSEEIDLQNANCLCLVYPYSFEGKLTQYLNRVQRSEITPVIYDYRDIKVEYLNRMFLKRNVYYRKLYRQASLINKSAEEINDSKNVFTIEKKIKILIEELEFRYGSIAFKYNVSEINTVIEFEIENPEARPEFEVLKLYFVKILKSKNVKIDIYAEFENGKLISQLASSGDLNKINHELIESVKFDFIYKNILGMPYQPNANILDIHQIQNVGENQHSLYNSGEKLLYDILKYKKVNHRKQLLFLAQRHNRSVLKIRFVLNPFSFVFLLSGNEQYHIVLETLDTEEATYIWHFAKEKRTLKIKLKEIDQQLNIIKNKGRQSFLETEPGGFNRIVHDYSNEKKGFIIWKDLLEERLT